MRVSLLLEVEPDRPAERAIAVAARTLLAGGLVVFPTETFYGIAADARSEAACRRVFALKGRTEDKALPCIAADLEQVERFTKAFPERARRLAERFWPGPLSLVLDAAPSVAAAAADGTIAVRVSGLALARQIASAIGGLTTATSANRSGDPPAATWNEVDRSFGDAAGVDLVLDGGPCRGGQPSTVVDVRSATPKFLRVGSVSVEMVLQALS